MLCCHMVARCGNCIAICHRCFATHWLLLHKPSDNHVLEQLQTSLQDFIVCIVVKFSIEFLQKSEQSHKDIVHGMLKKVRFWDPTCQRENPKILSSQTCISSCVTSTRCAPSYSLSAAACGQWKGVGFEQFWESWWM